MRSCIVLISVLSSSLTVFAEDGLRNSAIRSWASQQEHLKNGRFKYAGNNRVRSVESQPQSEPPISKSGPYELEIVIDGELGRSRVETDKPIYSSRTNSLHKQTHLAVFDGLDHSRILRTRKSWAGPVGTIYDLNQNSEIQNVHYRPIILAFRMLTQQPGVSDIATELIVKPETVDHNGVTLSVLKTRRGNYEFWVDPKNDFVIKRWISFSRGVQRALVDTEYKKIDNVWVPLSWESTVWGSVSESRQEYALKSFTLNKELPDELFRITFPAGTLVTDLRKKPAPSWVVTAEGGKRPVDAKGIAIHRSGGITE